MSGQRAIGFSLLFKDAKPLHESKITDMKISHQQMTAFNDYVYESFVRRLMEFVGTESARDCAVVDPSLLAREGLEREGQVRELLDRAECYEIATERGLAAFVLLGCTYSARFDEIPEVRYVLHDPFLTPDERILQIAARVSATWDEARAAKGGC